MVLKEVATQDAYCEQTCKQSEREVGALLLKVIPIATPR